MEMIGERHPRTHCKDSVTNPKQEYRGAVEGGRPCRRSRRRRTRRSCGKPVRMSVAGTQNHTPQLPPRMVVLARVLVQQITADREPPRREWEPRWDYLSGTSHSHSYRRDGGGKRFHFPPFGAGHGLASLMIMIMMVMIMVIIMLIIILMMM